MSARAKELMWLDNYLQGYLWPDDDWLQRDPRPATDGDAATYCVYWQARLAQTTSVQAYLNGDIKWRVRTRIVNDVDDASTAFELCLALNKYAAGWSFAYDPDEKSVDALLAIYTRTDSADALMRLSEAAKLCAWMCDVIAEVLADTVKGTPAFSHPAKQDRVRESFDGTYYYLETLRARPEWVMNRTWELFPPTTEIAQALAEMTEAEPDAVKVHDDHFVDIALTDDGSYHLSAYFAEHPVVGHCWRSYVTMPGVVSEHVVVAANLMAWQLFNDDGATLLGAWTYAGRDLAFEQWTSTSELRNLEQVPGFVEHGIQQLVSLASSLIDAVHVTREVDWADARVEGGLSEAYRNALAERVIGAVTEVSRPALAEAPAEDGEPTDRRLLWMNRQAILAAAAWFNPIGPSVVTLEVCTSADTDDQYLVYFMRHPLFPDYRVLGSFDPAAGTSEALSVGVERLLRGGSLPTAVWLAPAEGVQTAILQLLHDGVVRARDEDAIDLAAAAARLAENVGRPWDLAPGARPRELASTSSHEAEPAPLDTDPRLEVLAGAVDDEFAAWWLHASRFENVAAQFADLPDAWDGSLNLQVQAGPGLGAYDTGPLIVKYSPWATNLPSLEERRLSFHRAFVGENGGDGQTTPTP